MSRWRGAFVPLVMGLLFSTAAAGCWYRHVVYDFDGSNRWGGRCVGRLAEVHPDGAKHALWRKCHLYALPPLYYCLPFTGFRSDLYVLSKTPAPVTVTIDSYRVAYGDPPLSVDPCVPAASQSAPLKVVQVAESHGTATVEGIKFCFPGDAATARLEIRGSFKAAADVEPFECSWTLTRHTRPLTWTFPFTVIE
jgi:hypothetical protein